MNVAAALSAYEHQKLANQKRGRVTRRALDQALGSFLAQELHPDIWKDLAPAVAEIARDAPVNADRIVAYLNAFFAWAVARGYLKNLSTPPPPKLAGIVRRERILTVEELVAVWGAAGDIAHPFGPIVRLLILTATRREDVAGMRVSELKPDATDGLSWTVGGDELHARPFEVYLGPLAKSVLEGALERRREGSDLIFSKTGTTPFSGWSSAKRRLDAAVRERLITTDAESTVGGSDWRLDDLRRTFRAIAVESLGVRPPVAESCLNRISSFTSPIGREWARSEAMVQERRGALTRWSDWLDATVAHNRAATCA